MMRIFIFSIMLLCTGSISSCFSCLPFSGSGEISEKDLPNPALENPFNLEPYFTASNSQVDNYLLFFGEPLEVEVYWSTYQYESPNDENLRTRDVPVFKYSYDGLVLYACYNRLIYWELEDPRFPLGNGIGIGSPEEGIHEQYPNAQLVHTPQGYCYRIDRHSFANRNLGRNYYSYSDESTLLIFVEEQTIWKILWKVGNHYPQGVELR